MVIFMIPLIIVFIEFSLKCIRTYLVSMDMHVQSTRKIMGGNLM